MFNPDWATPPSATVKDILEERGETYSSFVEKMGWTNEVGELFANGDLLLTKEIAVKLEKVVGSTTEFWDNREKNYRKRLARGAEKVL